MSLRAACLALLACAACEAAPSPGAPAPAPPAPPAPKPVQPPAPKTVQDYIRVDTPRVVLTHVRVIDGTGKPAVADRNVVLERGKITAISDGADVAATADTRVLDLRGYSVMPGIVGMHDHMFYIARPNYDEHGNSEDPLVVPEMMFSSPRLYLAAGVTTLRTTGSVEPVTDLNLKADIDAGKLIGPHMDVTGPYIEGATSPFLQMQRLRTPDEARQLVNYWADRGATSFKAYMNITRAELKAAIDAAHKRKLKITGHLCSVTYKEAAELGIDNLEHGFFVNTQLNTDKKPDECPKTGSRTTLMGMAPDSAEAKALFATLIKHKVAVTSTLPVFEPLSPGRPPLRQAVLDTMMPQARQAYLWVRKQPVRNPGGDEAFKRGMAMERAFVQAGGLLIAGPDPTGNGGTLPGFGDQRELELLVEAGFSPVEAIQIATLNGAIYLGRDKDIGSIATGKHADLVVIKGDPTARIADVENVEIVFKDGVGYDSAKLFASVKDRYGQY